MNWFDIIVALLLVWSIWRGYSTGFIRQAIAIVALGLGVWLAFAFGLQVGLTLGLDELLAAPVGFIVVFAVVVLALAILGLLTKGLFRFAGLGVFDSILGVVLSLVKTWAIMSILCSWLCSWAQLDNQQPSKSSITTSIVFPAFIKTADFVFPYVDMVKEQLSEARGVDNEPEESDNQQ